MSDTRRDAPTADEAADGARSAGDARRGPRSGGTGEEGDLPGALRDLDDDRLQDLDVREQLRQGGEPFGRIMAAVADLPADGVLRLRAIFEPVPLYSALAGRGFEHWTERLGPEDWRVWFYRPGAV